MGETIMNCVYLTDEQVAYLMESLDFAIDECHPYRDQPETAAEIEMAKSCIEALKPDDYSHLWESQRTHILDTTINAIVDDCRDGGYLVGVVEALISLLPMKQVLEWLSSEHDSQCIMLGFDPETGEECDGD